MEKGKRITWQYFILPLAALISLYAGVAWFVSTRIFHQPTPKPITLIKYSVSRFADFIDFDFDNFPYGYRFRKKIWHSQSVKPAMPVRFPHPKSGR